MDGVPPENASVIELRLTTLAQLFNSLDPSPFHERDIDSEAEAYIVGWARELPLDRPLAIIVHLPAVEAAKARDRGLEAALAHYFGERARIIDLDLKELFRTGRRNLGISLPLLMVCLLAAQATRLCLGDGPLPSVLRESFVIVGWVANWKPLETFLYDWWPLARRRDLFRRLAAAKIEIRVRE